MVSDRRLRDVLVGIGAAVLGLAIAIGGSTLFIFIMLIQVMMGGSTLHPYGRLVIGVLYLITGSLGTFTAHRISRSIWAPGVVAILTLAIAVMAIMSAA